MTVQKLKTMRAIGVKTSPSFEAKDCLTLFETTIPQPSDRDLLVKIEAISVNPVDYKVRQGAAKDSSLSSPKILGWDATGIVEAIGKQVTLFKPGDRVFYAGDLTRPGTNAEYHVVDERIVGIAPKTLSLAETAAMPLTSLTAWEILFDQLRIDPARDKGKSILIIGGAGGVGSVAIQLAKQIANLTVLATASRPETQSWCRNLGADHIIDHKKLIESVRAAGFHHVDYIIDLVDTYTYWDAMVELIRPQGHIGSITGSAQPIQLNKLKGKSVSFSWELMYTRSTFQTEDMGEQGQILNQMATLLDKGIIRSTLSKTLEGFTLDNFITAHTWLESGKAIGKVALVSNFNYLG